MSIEIEDASLPTWDVVHTTIHVRSMTVPPAGDRNKNKKTFPPWLIRARGGVPLAVRVA